MGKRSTEGRGKWESDGVKDDEGRRRGPVGGKIGGEGGREIKSLARETMRKRGEGLGPNVSVTPGRRISKYMREGRGRGRGREIVWAFI